MPIPDMLFIDDKLGEHAGEKSSSELATVLMALWYRHCNLGHARHHNQERVLGEGQSAREAWSMVYWREDFWEDSQRHAGWKWEVEGHLIPHLLSCLGRPWGGVLCGSGGPQGSAGEASEISSIQGTGQGVMETCGVQTKQQQQTPRYEGIWWRQQQQGVSACLPASKVSGET